MDAGKESMRDDNKNGAEHTSAGKHGFGSMFRRDPVSKLAELLDIKLDFRQSFEQDVAELSDLTSKSVNGEMFNKFGDTIEDQQHIHRDEEVAKAYKPLKLRTKPAFGVLTMAYAEEHLSRLLSIINLYTGKGFVYSGMVVKLKQPLYPNESIVFNIEKSFRADKETGGININVSGTNKDGEKVVDILSLGLRYKRHEPGKGKFPVCPSSEEVDMIHHRRIDRAGLDSYFECLDEHKRYEIPSPLVSATAPAAISKFSREKAGELEGIYMSAVFEYYNDARIGDFKTFIEFMGTKEKRGLYNHTFLTWCFQEEMPMKPIFSAELVCRSPTKIE